MSSSDFEFHDAKENDIEEWLLLASKLLEDTSEPELRSDYQQMMSSSKYRNILVRKDQVCIGFIDISLRSEYVEGATSTPVGYIEGIFIEEAYRKNGIARKLMEMAEEWFISKGCKEIGSDTWEWNKDSQEFHKKLGFIEEDILVHFIKTIGDK